LGGTVSPTGHTALDVNGDGKVEVVYIAGGKLLAKLSDDTIVWETPALNLTTLVGVADLNGDGVLDVVGHSDRQVFVVSGKTGAIEWEEPGTDVGAIGSVRMGDFDGDGLSDVFVDECGCCGTSNGAPGFAYRFPTGFTGVTTPMWKPASRPHCGAVGNTAGDWDGDGKLDIALFDASSISFVKGTDGTLLPNGKVTIGNASTWAYRANCFAANVDSNPGDEAICFEDGYWAAQTAGARQVWVIGYTSAGGAKVLWTKAITDRANGRMVHTGLSLSNLDGQGNKEITVGEYDGTSWVTRTYDAVDGSVLGTITGESLGQVVDLDGDGKPEILTWAGGTLKAYKFVRGGAPYTLFWSLPGGASILNQVDWTLQSRIGNPTIPLTVDLDSDGKPEWLAYASTASGGVLRAYAADANPPTVKYEYKVPTDVTLLTNQIFGQLNRPYRQVAVTRSDGFLTILDNRMAATNEQVGQESYEKIPGMRVGGYYSGSYGAGQVPIAPRLDGTSDSVLARDSRGRLLRLDAATASMLVPPTVAWQKNGRDPTAVATLLSGKPAVVYQTGSTTEVIKPDGTLVKSIPITGSPSYDALPGDVNGDGIPDLFVVSTISGPIANVQVYRGDTFMPVWATPYTEAISAGMYRFAVGFFDSNAVSDIFIAINRLHIFAGNTGTRLGGTTASLSYAVPTLDDIDGDGVEDITLSSTYGPAHTLRKDMSVMWKGLDDRPYPYGAKVVCDNAGTKEVIWVQPSLSNLGQVRFYTMTGPTPGDYITLFFGGGEVFPDAATAAASGVRLGVIGNVTAKPNLLGTDGHTTMLFGSTDGFLYAYDPCLARLDWTYNFRFPVGEAIFADTSGDGIDEVLVTVADGYLYRLSQQLVPAPKFVNDTDPTNGITTEDVDQITTRTTLHGAWEPIAEADSYEIAIVTPGGSFVTQPSWRNVGKATSATIQELSLIDGKKYFFAVRAISTTKGASPIASSDGVTVTLGDPPLPPSGGEPEPETGSVGGCGCDVAGKPNVYWFHLALFLVPVLAMTLRRFRKRTSAPHQ
jgi:hypothetical protein